MGHQLSDWLVRRSVSPCCKIANQMSMSESSDCYMPGAVLLCMTPEVLYRIRYRRI